MDEKEMLERAEKFTESLLNSIIWIGAAIALVRIGFEAGSSHKARELSEPQLFHMGD